MLRVVHRRRRSLLHRAMLRVICRRVRTRIMRHARVCVRRRGGVTRVRRRGCSMLSMFGRGAMRCVRIGRHRVRAVIHFNRCGGRAATVLMSLAAASGHRGSFRNGVAISSRALRSHRVFPAACSEQQSDGKCKESMSIHQ
jgi:hypothetical protein